MHDMHSPTLLHPNFSKLRYHSCIIFAGKDAASSLSFIYFQNVLLFFRSPKQSSHLPLTCPPLPLRSDQMLCQHPQRREARARQGGKVCSDPPPNLTWWKMQHDQEQILTDWSCVTCCFRLMVQFVLKAEPRLQSGSCSLDNDSIFLNCLMYTGYWMKDIP